MWLRASSPRALQLSRLKGRYISLCINFDEALLTYLRYVYTGAEVAARCRDKWCALQRLKNTLGTRRAHLDSLPHGRTESGDMEIDGKAASAEGAKTGCAPRHAGKWCRVHGRSHLRHRESRWEALSVRWWRRYCLFFPISSRFYRTVRALSVSLSWLHRDVGEVVRTQKYQTALVPFCNGVFIEKRVATRDTCARCKRVFGDARRCGFAPQNRLLFIAALSFCNSRLRLIF